jgi:hypothetical protein
MRILHLNFINILLCYLRRLLIEINCWRGLIYSGLIRSIFWRGCIARIVWFIRSSSLWILLIICLVLFQLRFIVWWRCSTNTVFTIRSCKGFNWEISNHRGLYFLFFILFKLSCILSGILAQYCLFRGCNTSFTINTIFIFCLILLVSLSALSYWGQIFKGWYVRLWSWGLNLFLLIKRGLLRLSKRLLMKILARVHGWRFWWICWKWASNLCWLLQFFLFNLLIRLLTYQNYLRILKFNSDFISLRIKFRLPQRNVFINNINSISKRSITLNLFL